MARSAASAKIRVRKLGLSLADAKKFQPGETLTATPMAKLLGVSWPSLRAWCLEVPNFAESGCYQIGGQGSEYIFNPVATIWFLIRHFENVSRGELEKSGRHAEIIGVQHDDDADAMTFDEQAKALRNQNLVMDNMERQGRLVSADGIRARDQRVFPNLIQIGLRAADKLDPTGQWDIEKREVALLTGRTILGEQRQYLLQEIEGLDELLAEAGGH